MSCVEENWQTARPTIRERSKFMFNNDLFSDVKFVVRKMDGESESKQVIPAHKFVLSISSPVFEAMFYGELAEASDSIELPDCEYESLLELFRYMYSDEVNLSGSNVMGVFYLAKKYMVPSLAQKCMAFLKTNLDPSNVFSILPSAEKYEEKNLVEQCWEVIDEQAGAAVKSDGFATIDRSFLEALVERDTLNIEEVELFKAVNLWATKKCEEQGLSADGSEKRKILGERIVKGIRFPVMKQREFVGVVLDCKILTQDEAFDIVKYLHSVLDTAVGFPENKRIGWKELFKRCSRFGSMDHTGAGHPCSNSKTNCLVFTVEKDISLIGVTLCGSESSKYSVALKIINVDRNEVVASKSGEFSPELIRFEPISYYGFNVLFDGPTVLKEGVRYRVEGSISGASTCSGQSGKQSVLCSGVRFNFKKCCSKSDTNVEQGQFPEILFTLT